MRGDKFLRNERLTNLREPMNSYLSFGVGGCKWHELEGGGGGIFVS